MTICREWLLVKTIGSVATAEPLKCRSWTCDHCGPLRRRQLIAAGISGEPNTFITLTCNPRLGTSPSHRARMMVAAWRLIRRWAADMPGNGSVPFLAVFERHRSGEPHLHILCRSAWIDQKWLSRKAEQLGIGKICWIERIEDPTRTARYVAKYCGKDPARFDTVKRYWQSADYELNYPDEGERDDAQSPTFEVVKHGLDEWINARSIEGWIVLPTETGAIAWNVRALAQGPPLQNPVPVERQRLLTC